MLNLCQALLCLSLQFSNSVSDGDGSSIFLILLEIKYLSHILCGLQSIHAVTRMVQVALCRAISDWVMNSLHCLSRGGCFYTWVSIALRWRSPAVWCHAFRICIHMPTAYILLHLPGRAAGGICLSVSVLSFPVPLCWLIMKEKCNIQIKSWLGWYFREKWHLPSLNTVCTLKFYLIWITWRMMNRRQNLFCWGICVCLLIVNSLWLLK